MKKMNNKITPLSPDKLSYFRDLLLNKREQAVEEIDRLNESLSDISNDEDEYSIATSKQMDDIGADAEERQLNYTLQERERDYIKQIDAALERIENGTYGICAATGMPISEERLRSVPHTRYSIEAKKRGLHEPSDKP